MASHLLQNHKAYWIIAIVSFCAHGLLLISDAIIADGWLFSYWMQNKEWGIIGRFLSEAGVPQFTFLLKGLAWFPNPVVAAKLLAFGLILGNGFITFRILRTTKVLSGSHCLLITLLAQTCPLFQVSGDLSVIHYSLSYTLFLSGTLFAIHSLHIHKASHLLCRCLSWLCFLASYVTGSLLVFHLGLIIFLAWLKYGSDVKISGKWARQAFGLIDFILCPVFFWVIRKLYFPPHGAYLNYNEPEFSLTSLWSGFTTFVKGPFWDLGNHLISQAYLENPLLIFIIALILIWKWSALITFFRIDSQNPHKNKWIILWGLGLLVLALGAYIAVGRKFPGYGWDTRCLLLTPIPLALLIFGLIYKIDQKTSHGNGKAAAILFVIILCSFIIETNANLMRWQVDSVKCFAWQKQLSKYPGATDYRIFAIDDQWIIPRTISSYAPIHRTCQLFNAFQNETKFGYDSRDRLLANNSLYLDSVELDRIVAQTTLNYALTGITHSSRQCQIIIYQGQTGESIPGLALKYYIYKYIEKKRMEKFLNNLVTLQLTEIFPPR